MKLNEMKWDEIKWNGIAMDVEVYVLIINLEGYNLCCP
jgi:hypothetical protein